MMILVFYAAIVFGVLALIFFRFRIATTLLSFAWFGPVAWAYHQTGDDSLIFEFMFRTFILGSVFWVAVRLNNLLDTQESVGRGSADA